MSYAFLYPGQGSQKVGMGADLVEKSTDAQKRFAEADALLGRSLSDIILNGPEETLKDTRNTQPALFLVEAIITDALRAQGINPVVCMGHSLGEYSALYGAGVISFADGLKLVARRGELMAQVGQQNPGTMAAVIGMEKAKLAEVLSTVTEGIVVAANENTPDQIVISGSVAAVNAACEKLKAAGAKRALPLPVSGAFHSPLMQPAADAFAGFLDGFTFSMARCPVIANVTANKESDPAILKGLLIKQLISPVRWIDSVETLSTIGAKTYLEVGPGNVLKGLVGKCNSAINVVTCGTVENIFSLK